jgi:hypothetical protein
LLAVGVGVLVATRSEDLKPAITRGWGPVFDESTGRLELAVTAPQGSATLDNLASIGAIAVTASQPSTYRTMQMKGVVDRIDAPTQAHEERVSAHVEQFIAEVALLGVDPDRARNLFLGDLLIVGFTVTGLFDQTPRSGAGSKLW